MDQRSCRWSRIRVDWRRTECPTMDHVQVTPAEPRERVDLAIVTDG